MRKDDTPFTITVCGLDELAGHAGRKVSHVLSILDPGQPEPEAFGAYGEHARLELKFHDVIEESADYEAPQAEDVARILAFGRDLMADPQEARHLLVHCHMGISRSTASMALLLAQAQPDVPPSEIFNRICEIREKAWPNLRILMLGEEQLGRPGDLSRAAAAVYRRQLEKRPEIKDFFQGHGRAREVELALFGADGASL